MNKNKPILLNDIDYKSININNIYEENNFRKNLFLNYNDNNFIIQTPYLLFNNKLEEKNTYYELIIDLKCRNKLKSNKIINFLLNLEKHLINMINKNKSEYFNTEKKIKFKSIIRFNKDNNKYIKLKILKDSLDEESIKIIQNNNKISINNLKDKCYLKLLININAIWINNNIFGVYLKPILISKKDIDNFDNIKLIDDSETNKSILDSCIDSNINTLTQEPNNNNKVLISSVNNNSNNITIEKKNNSNSENLSITSYIKEKNDDDMTTINFNSLENIPEYNNDPKNKKLSKISEYNNELKDNNLSTTS